MKTSQTKANQIMVLNHPNAKALIEREVAAGRPLYCDCNKCRQSARTVR